MRRLPEKWVVVEGEGELELRVGLLEKWFVVKGDGGMNADYQRASKSLQALVHAASTVASLSTRAPRLAMAASASGTAAKACWSTPAEVNYEVNYV